MDGWMDGWMEHLSTCAQDTHNICPHVNRPLFVRLEGLGQFKEIHLIGTRTRDLPACSIVPQPTTLPRAPHQ
jgi:hypothetical protein